MSVYLCFAAEVTRDEGIEIKAWSPALAAERYAAGYDAIHGDLTERLGVMVSSDGGRTWSRYTVTARVNRVAVREG